MKKMKMLILSLLIVLTLSACKGEEEIVEIDEFDIFKEVIDRYSIENTNGVTVDAIQTLNGEVIHEEQIKQRIKRGAEVVASTRYFEHEIGLFDVEDTYVDTEIYTYYYNGQMITDVLGEELVYEDSSFDEYLVNSQLILKGLTKANFVTYTITQLEHIHILTGELTIGSVRSIFGTDISMVESNELTIVINEETKTFIEFEFYYTSAQTETSLSFTPYYDEVSIVLPSEEE